MQSIGYVVLAIVVLLIMITVHEFGHYVAGKLLGFGIEEFAIGFGPKLYSKKAKSGEVFSVRALPIGGFCAFKGEDEEDDDPKAFNNRKPWQRIIVLISGALMNFLLALLLIFLLFGAYGRPAYVVTEREEMGFPSLGQIEESAILKEGDVILSMNGRRVYLATDLMRAIEIPARIDFMSVSSYGSGTKTSGVVKIIKDLDINLKGYDIVIVEDILDSGKTLHYLVDLLKSREPNSIEICTLFDKPERREVDVHAKYIGCAIPDAFIVGYGLDYDEKYRNLPFVGVLKPEVYGA